MRHVLIFLICILLIPVVTAVDYEGGQIIDLYTIHQCEGPIKIKVTSEEGIQEGELKIEKCSTSDNKYWRCECVDKFDVKVMTVVDAHNMYDFTIEHYVEYDNPPSNATSPDMNLEINRRTYKIIDVYVKPKPTIKNVFKLDIKSKNTIILAITIVAILLLFGWYKFKKYVSASTPSNDDVLNYQQNDDDIEDLFNDIK